VVIMGTADRIREELDQLNADDASPGMAAIAYELAKAMDSTDAPTSKAVVARELSALMTKLHALSKPVGKGGALDDLTRKREKRLAEQRKRAGGDD
jgi:hypothetical protein